MPNQKIFNLQRLIQFETLKTKNSIFIKKSNYEQDKRIH